MTTELQAAIERVRKSIDPFSYPEYQDDILAICLAIEKTKNRQHELEKENAHLLCQF